MSASKGFLDENFQRKGNCECFCCIKNGYPKETYTKTSSIWHTRNNSSNVSSLLAPDLEQTSEKSTSNRSTLPKPIARKTIKSAPLTSKGTEVSSHCEDCYCRDNPNLPLLNLVRKDQDDVERWKFNLRRSIRCPADRKHGHGVRRLPKGLERKTRRCSCEINGSGMMGSSVQRDNLNITKNNGNQYESAARDLHRIVEAEEKSETHEDYRSEKTISSYDKPKSYKDFKEIAKFRNEQYFETHSTNDVTASVLPQHKCVHKFVIDDRLLPQPLNGDSYGVSRCDVCYKPMETFIHQRPRSQAPIKSSNKVREIYEYNLAPHRLNVGCGKEAVQIKVPEGLGKEIMWTYNNFKIKRKVPGNSFALRYQKGRV